VSGNPVPDGVYDVFIVDAAPDPNDAGRVARLDVTVVSGEHKGATFGLNVNGMDGSDTDLMGRPATMTVSGGIPTVTVDP
jgi:hypothetical protein